MGDASIIIGVWTSVTGFTGYLITYKKLNKRREKEEAYGVMSAPISSTFSTLKPCEFCHWSFDCARFGCSYPPEEVKANDEALRLLHRQICTDHKFIAVVIGSKKAAEQPAYLDSHGYLNDPPKPYPKPYPREDPLLADEIKQMVKSWVEAKPEETKVLYLTREVLRQHCVDILVGQVCDRSFEFALPAITAKSGE